MRWKDVERTVKVKLGGSIQSGSKHDLGFVSCGGQFVAQITIGRHKEMRNREIGNCARSLRLNENRFKALVSCTLSSDEYCALITEED